MWVDGQKLEGKLLGRDQVRAIYEDIVRRQRDPALLEYVGRGAFQASIFPIPPGGQRRIELTYSQVLPQTAGFVHYRYPLNTEKFSSADIDEVAVTVHLADKAPIRAIYSPSHPVEVLREGDRRATVSYEAQNIRPDRDFDLYYSLSSDAVAVNLLSYKPFDEDGFFLLLVTPPVESAGQVVAKDVVLVMDTSGSMDGERSSRRRPPRTTFWITSAKMTGSTSSRSARLHGCSAIGPCPRRGATRATRSCAAWRRPAHRHQPGAVGGAGGRRC